MNNASRWQKLSRTAKPGLKLATKLVMLTALRYGPAGVAGWAVKSVARRPVKLLLAYALEPLLTRAANRFSARYMGSTHKPGRK